MKKIFALLMVLALVVLAMAGCSSTKEKATDAAKEAAETVTEAAEEVRQQADGLDVRLDVSVGQRDQGRTEDQYRSGGGVHAEGRHWIVRG